VIPGMTISKAFADRGFRVGVATYDNGIGLLKRSTPCWLSRLFELKVMEPFVDWPGLSLYDRGIREIAPILVSHKVSLCILGGEYILPAVLSSLGIKSALLFNPEILEDNPRNKIPTSLFCTLFDFCDYLIPMDPIPAQGIALHKGFDALRCKLTPAGPFTFKLKDCRPTRGRIILVANGGGVSFPTKTASYSSSGVSSHEWREETWRMTVVAVETALHAIGPDDRVIVFSCFDENRNSELRSMFDIGPGLDIKIAISCAETLVYQIV